MACGAPQRTGVTSCGTTNKECQAGQYCSDETFGYCSAGCLSNNNCSAEQQCIKPAGVNEGTCQSGVVQGTAGGAGGGSTTPDCTAFCSRMTTCGFMGDCATLCARVSGACRQCTVDAPSCASVDTSCEAPCTQ
ncbi:MAG: hypothetical protein JNK82_40170 [Myxococcaceae bacterium]|nr:hypothetical protein [Myxococcaceae bacterium]